MIGQIGAFMFHFGECRTPWPVSSHDFMPTTSPASGAQARTQQAIIDAAVRCLAADFTASLADIADEAGIGRTTLRRYFSERNDLLAAISATALARSSAAIQRARLTEGPALDAVGRFCEEHFEIGDILILVLDQPQLSRAWSDESTKHALLELIARGKAEGTIEPEIPPEWAYEMIWTHLYAGMHYKPQDGTSRYGALSLCLTSLKRVLETRN
ncbi:MAG TPA: TetR/AcrR family transcriptional regulator [Baekduia sp.]|nr:TetR/AcrR family transcriptional regulator [Baekduia sp.]